MAYKNQYRLKWRKCRAKYRAEERNLLNFSRTKRKKRSHRSCPRIAKNNSKEQAKPNKVAQRPKRADNIKVEPDDVRRCIVME